MTKLRGTSSACDRSFCCGFDEREGKERVMEGFEEKLQYYLLLSVSSISFVKQTSSRRLVSSFSRRRFPRDIHLISATQDLFVCFDQDSPQHRVSSCPRILNHRILIPTAQDCRHIDHKQQGANMRPLHQKTPRSLLLASLLLLLIGLFCSNDPHHVAVVTAFTSTPFGVRPDAKLPPATLTMTTEDSSAPSTFREAEVLGLKLMQEQKYREALQGTSRSDI